jgi:hypothetical protein
LAALSGVRKLSKGYETNEIVGISPSELPARIHDIITHSVINLLIGGEEGRWISAVDFDFEQILRDIHIESTDLNQEAVGLAAKIRKNFEGQGI